MHRRWEKHRQYLLTHKHLTMSNESNTVSGQIVEGTNGGKHLVDAPLTTDVVRMNSNFLLDEIDQHIVKIRPMATPVDQISRLAGSKASESMVVDFYSVDTKPTVAITTEEYVEPTPQTVTLNASRIILPIEDGSIFEVSETVLCLGVQGYNEKSEPTKGQDLVLYILAKNDFGEVTAVAVNGKQIGIVANCVPSIPEGTKLIRMGRAATELDVQTAQFESIPTKEHNYCQIFKMQIEQSTLQKIARKEVDWTFSDQEEAAIYDMRLGMEKSFLFGVRNRLYDTVKKENVMLTGGIWAQCGKQYDYSSEDFSQDTLISIMREAFTGNAGSKRKILIAGSGLIERLNKLETTKVVTSTDTVVKWGIDFTEINSKFGKLYVLLSEVFDECNKEDCGIIIDPEYIQKYSHIPFNSEELHLKQAGLRNTDAIVLTEASCLTLRYPKAHMRIVMKNNA